MAVRDFVDQYSALASSIGERIGVSPNILLGQWGLETGWGKSVIPGTNNLGNIKSFDGSGVAATDNMTGSNDNYRQYGDSAAFGNDFASLLERRYKNAIGAGNDAESYAKALKSGGYAEDPAYVKKLITAANMARDAGASDDGRMTGKGNGFDDYFVDSPRGAPKAPRAAISTDGFSNDYFLPEAPSAPVSKAGLMSDTGNLLKSGVNQVASGLREAVRQIPVVGDSLVSGADAADKFVTGKTSDEILKGDNDRIQGALSDKMRGALDKKWWNSETQSLGDAWTDPRAYAGGIIQSLPGTLLTMIPAGRLAKMAYEAKVATLGAEEAAKAAARTAMLAGGAGEGLLSAGQTAGDVREELAKLPQSVWDSSDAYKSLIASGMDDASAKAALTNDAATKGFLIAGVTTAMFGGQGDRVLALAMRGGVSGGIGKRIVKGAIGEGFLEEAPQSYTQEIAKNVGVQTVDPTRQTTEGAFNAALGGLAVGAVQGGGMNALLGRAAPERTAKDAETLSEAATLPVTPVVTPDEIAAIPQAPAELSPREQRQQAVADKLYPLPTQRETAPTADRQLEAINAINPLPEQRDGTIGVRQTPFTDAEIAAGVEPQKNESQQSPQAAAIALGARTLKKGDTVELDDGGSFTIDGAGPMKRSNPDGPWIYNVIWDNGKNAAFDDAEMSQQLGPQPYRSADFEQKYSAPAVVKRSEAERAQAPARAIEEAYRLNEREQQDAAFQQGQQPQGKTPLAFNEAAAAGGDDKRRLATVGGAPDAPQVTLRANGQPFATLKAAETSIKARGLSGAVAVSVKGGGFGIRMAAPASAQNTAPAQAIPQNSTASVSPAPVQDTSLKATATLAQAIRKFGGLPEKFARDLTGEPALTANKMPGYRGLFHASGTDLSTLVHDGKLDAYLPPNLRSDVRDDSRPTDTDAAVAHIEAILRNGEAQTAKSYARTEAKQQRLTAAAQKQQVVAPIEKGDTQASADAISEAEYEHYKQTGEPGFGWMPARTDAIEAVAELSDDDLAIAALVDFTKETQDASPIQEVAGRDSQAQEAPASGSETDNRARAEAPPAAEVTKTGDERARDAELFRKTKSRLIAAFTGKSGENFDELSKTLTARANDKNDPQSKLAAEVLDNFDGWKGNYEQRQAFEKNRESANPNEAAAKALESAAAALREVGRPGAANESARFTHKGLEISRGESKRDGVTSSRWFVQSPENAERAKRGERQIGGDSIVDSREAAIVEADRLVSAFAKDNAEKAETLRAEKEAQAKEDERKGKNKGRGIAEIQGEKLLGELIRLDGDVVTKAQWVERKLASGAALKITQIDKVAPMSSRAAFKATNEEIRAHKKRVEAGGKKDVFWIGDFDVTKTEYDYAKRLLENEARPALDLTNPTESKLRTDDAKQKRDAAEKAAKENAPSPEEFGLVGSNRAADVGAAAGQNALFQNTASYGNNAANENESYATDLFGDPIPSATRAPRADSAKRPALRRDAQPKPALRDTERPDGEYLASTIVGTSGERELGVSRILTAEHAAAATRYLYRSAVERFDAIVTDKNGKPLAVVGGFKGAPTQTAVYPSVVIAEAMRVPGAANIWLSHNHPSGSETLSHADIRLESTFSDALRGSGIQHMGLLAVAGDRRYSHVYDGNITKGESRGPGSATISVPVIERELADNRIDKVSVNAPDIAKQVARDFYEKSNGPGVILLDAQHKLLGWMTITPNMYGALRGKSGGLNAIYRALSHSGAVSGIIAHGGELDARIGDIERVTASQNIAAALSKVDVSPLDSINVKTGKNVAMIGDRVAEGPLFSRSDTIEIDGQQRPRNNSNGKPIAATDEGIRNFWRWFADSRVVDDQGRPLVVYHGTTKAGFSVFDTDGKGKTAGTGAFFTQSTRGAMTYSNTKKDATISDDPEFDPKYDGESGNYPVYLRITDPETFDFDGQNWDSYGAQKEWFARDESGDIIEYFTNEADANHYRDTYDGFVEIEESLDTSGAGSTDDLAREARSSGRDGLILENITDEGPFGQGYGWDEKVWVAFSPNQIKSATNNTGQFSPDNADIRFSREAPLWRSTLTEAIGKTSFAQAPADQWKAWLNANAAKLGVKKDEIEWSGVTDWLDLQKGKVTRDQVREFLDANGVKVTETELAGQKKETFDEYKTRRGIEEREGRVFANGFELNGGIERVRRDFESGQDVVDQTKYGQYQLPGGENYRELLLTLPNETTKLVYPEILTKLPDGYHLVLDDNKREGFQWAITPPGQLSAMPYAGSHGTEAAAVASALRQLNAERNQRAADEWRAKNEDSKFKSSHWDQPNILAHIRFNERADSEGKRVLFIEEIQSDWGQAAKKSGVKKYYAPSELSALTREESIAEFGAQRADLFWHIKAPDNIFEIAKSRHETADAALAYVAKEKPKNSGGVPDAPMIGKTEAWVSLALKRMIRYAVDNGFDRIAMVNGEQSAERYDLSKSVDSLLYKKNGDGTFSLSAITQGRGNPMGDAIPEAKLEDYVGKDIAKKIVNGDGKRTEVQGKYNPVSMTSSKDYMQELSGVDLKVGGEGMKAFYDRIVPQVANDVLKKLGGGKLGVVELQIPGQEAGERDAATGAIVGPNGTRGKNFDAAGFDITDKMREHAAQGMPLFRRDEQQPAATNTHAADVIAKAAKTVNIPLDVYATPQEASAKLGIYIPSDVRGLHYRGRAALISSNITTPAMGEFVLWHELFHAGITQVAPRYGNEYNRIMQDMAARNSNIIKAARDWRTSYGAETIKRSMEAGLSQEQAEKRMRLMAIEEAIADLAGANIELKGWTQFVAKLQALLRSMGFDNLANWIEGKSNAEVLQLIARTRDEVTTQNLHLTTQVPAFARDEDDASYQRAYHGTPHKFDKFSLDKIGTGEGAQAYGYGLYFASKREIAEHYRNALGRPDSAGLSRAQDLAAWAYSMQSPYAGDAMEHLNDEIARMERHGKFNDKVIRSDYEEAKRIVASGEVISNGKLYQVDIPEDSEMLHWDKPLSEQPEAVKVALEKSNPALFQKNWYDAETKQPTELGETSGKMLNGVLSEVMDGSEYYRSLSSQTGGGAQASTKLRSLGIRGIKYLDGGSRNAGDGSYNYVVFDDKDVSIEAVHSRADDVSAIQRKIAQQESFNAQRAEKLPADHPLVSTGKRALARLQQELADAKEKSAGFDRWFEGSKAVDARGSPLVLYHGTSNDFSTFRRKTGGRAIWAADTETANSYAGESDGSNVMPVYMAMRNPLTVNADGATWQDLWFEGERLGADHLADIAEERGHDGLIIRDLRDHDTDEGGEIPADHYAVFKPTQVKSATGNTGAFSPDNADIRFSRSEQETETLPRGALTDKLLALRAVPDKLNRPHVYKVLALINEASKSKTLGSVAVFDAAKAEMKSLIEQANALTDNPSLKGFVGGQWGSVPKQKAVQPIARASSPKPSIALSAIDGLLQKADQTTDISERLDTALDAMKYAIRNGSAAAEDLFWQARDIAQSVVEEANSKLESEFLASGVFQNPENLMRNRDIIEIIRNGESPQWGIRDHSASFDRTTLNIVSSGRWSIDRLTNTADFQSANEQTTSQDGDVAFSRTGSGDIFDKNATAAQSTYNGTEAVQGMGMSVKNVMRQTANIARDKRGAALSFLGGRQIADIYSKDVPELPKYNEILQRMQAEQNEGSAVADSIIEKWRVINRKRPEVATQLSSLMHDSTLAQVDPDVSADNAELRKRWINLPQEAKDIYREARDAYVAHFEKVKAELIDRVERSALDTSAKNRTLASMREEFTKAMKGVYFPLARFGDYMVVVKDKAGVTQSVSMAETTNQAQALRAELLRAYPDYIVGAIQKKKEFNAERDGVSRGFMKDLVALISEEPDAQTRDSQLDAINQLWLSSLPDLSWAKSGIHRKGTPGYSNDAMRAFARNMFHGGYHLAKLRYGDRLGDTLAQMQETIDNKVRSNPEYSNVVAQSVVDEMNARHKHVMNPQNTPVANALTGLGFMWHMGLSPASAVVNLSQTALVAYPMLASKFGFGKAATMLLSLSADAVKGKNDLLSQLQGAEKDAYDRAVREGLIDVTMAHDLAGVSQGKSGEFNEKQQRVMRVASVMFHEAEKFNRGVTFMSAYRLAVQSGVSDPYKLAHDLTFDSHFDYSSQNRPRVMQGPTARVILLFKQYGQNMIYTLSRNTFKALQGDREAQKTLAGLLAMHGMFAGALGLPLMTTLLAAASAIGGSDDEPWDAQVALRNYLADVFGKDIGEVLAHGVFRAPGIKDAIGADISGRVGLDSMLIRMPQETLEGKKYYQALLETIAGPVFGIGGNIANGMQTMAQGNTLRGIEEMLPKSIKDPLKAYRYEQDGIQDKTGITIVDETTIPEEVAQFLGFSPARGMEGFEGKSAIKNQETLLTQRRRQLMQRYGKDAEEGDTADSLTAIQRWNIANPTMAIKGQDLLRSMREKAKRQAEAENGAYLSKKRRGLAELGEFANAE